MKLLRITLLTIALTFIPAAALADATTTPLDEASSTPPIATSTPPTASSTPETASITIHDGSVTAFSGIVALPDASSSDVAITPTHASSSRAIPARSLLALLEALDASSTDFDITNLAYFSSFNSFIINCITVSAASTTPDCFNWTYAVNGTFPQISVDHQILQNGDVVYLFFGPSRQTILSTTTAMVDKPFTATAQRYDLASGTYTGAPGLTLGVGTPNPDFSFTALATSTSDENGEAIFSIHATGTFAVGIAEDFYFPSASITITDLPATSTEATSTPSTDNPPPSSGGGGPSNPQFNVGNALAYLVSKQHTDGSFDSPLLTDWATLTFAASDPGSAKTNLRNYLLAATSSLSAVTDYERHAMALEALNISPYSGAAADYIMPIVNSFDGTQIGETSLDNDDIFALFPLLHAGYVASDNIIQKTTGFIISRQLPSGAWDSSIDVTAAAIQALSQVTSLPNISSALTKAESYLHSQQQANGGFGNSFSTSWALQAIAALNQSPASWAPAGFNPKDYLVSLQQSDGGVEPLSSDTQTRQWATEYAIPGILDKTWALLLSSFGKPANTSGGGTVLGASTSTIAVATSTAPSATSTPVVASSALAVQTATSTPIPAITQSTTTEAKSVPAKPKIHKITPPIKPAPPTPPTTVPLVSTAQTAAANASLPEKNGFFESIWHAIISFFSRLF